MDNNLIKGRTFSEETTAVKDEDGFWKIDVTMSEKVVYNDGTEREESINAMGMDKDFGIAHQMALFAALSELRELVYDKNLDSLIEGRELQRKLEAENGGSRKADEDTPTQ